MNSEIRYKPSFATLFVTLNPGEKIVAEAGSMVSMSGKLSMKTEFFGGFIPGLMKSFLGRESLFVNVFTNQSSQPQELVLTQSSIGDIVRIELQNNEMCFQPGVYIAHTSGIKVAIQWAGLASWIAGEGLFTLKMSGRGVVFCGAYGGISEVRVQNDFIVDSGHLVAYEPKIKMNIKLAGGLLSSLMSGEGLVNRLSGRGKIYLQSRSVDGLVRFLRSKF